MFSKLLLKPDEALSMSIDGIFGLIPSCWNTSVELIKVGDKNEK